MKTNPVKEKLKRGEPTFGTWLSLGNLYAARVLARMGWDWLTLDLEHSPIDMEQAAAIFGAVADAGGVPLVRVPDGSHHWIKRVLDAGAMGIVVPMVDTVEQSQAAIAAAKYPPQGNRSAGGGLSALNFAASSDEYFAAANDQILVVLQTESPRGVENAEAIYACPAATRFSSVPWTCGFRCELPTARFPPPMSTRPWSNECSPPAARPAPRRASTPWTRSPPGGEPNKACSSWPSAATCG